MKRNLFVFIILGIVITMGCSIDISERISKEKAQEIALYDAPNFKPNHSNFEIYSVKIEEMSYRNSKKMYDSWIVVIRSQAQNADQSIPNILYQIHAIDGTIIDKTNLAFTE